MTRPGVDLLLWDINGVLYSYDPAMRVAALAETVHSTDAEVKAALFDSGLEDDADAGRVGGDTYLQLVSGRLGRTVSRAMWIAAFRAGLRPEPDVVDLAGRAAGSVRCATLSNNSVLASEEAPVLYPELIEIGVEVHVAAEVRAPKPTPAAYGAVCRHLGAEPARTGFIDDSPVNVTGAETAGLRTHRFVGAEVLTDFLTDLGVLTR